MEGSAEDLRRQREEVLGVLRSRQRGCPFTAFGLAALVQVRCAIPSARLPTQLISLFPVVGHPPGALQGAGSVGVTLPGWSLTVASMPAS